MSTYELNMEGERQVVAFVLAHGNVRACEGIRDSPDAPDAWFDDVDCGENCLGHFEVGSFYSASGNPVTTTLGLECFDVVDDH